jgi:hypothetical protein
VKYNVLCVEREHDQDSVDKEDPQLLEDSRPLYPLSSLIPGDEETTDWYGGEEGITARCRHTGEKSGQSHPFDCAGLVVVVVKRPDQCEDGKELKNT